MLKHTHTHTKPSHKVPSPCLEIRAEEGWVRGVISRLPCRRHRLEWRSSSAAATRCLQGAARGFLARAHLQQLHAADAEERRKAAAARRRVWWIGPRSGVRGGVGEAFVDELAPFCDSDVDRKVGRPWPALGHLEARSMLGAQKWTPVSGIRPMPKSRSLGKFPRTRIVTCSSITWSFRNWCSTWKARRWLLRPRAIS